MNKSKTKEYHKLEGIKMKMIKNDQSKPLPNQICLLIGLEEPTNLYPNWYVFTCVGIWDEVGEYWKCPGCDQLFRDDYEVMYWMDISTLINDQCLHDILEEMKARFKKGHDLHFNKED